MADVTPDPRKPISPGQAMDASDTHKEAAARVPEENINPKVETREPGEHIVVSEKDKALEASKRGDTKKDEKK